MNSRSLPASFIFSTSPTLTLRPFLGPLCLSLYQNLGRNRSQSLLPVHNYLWILQSVEWLEFIYILQITKILSSAQIFCFWLQRNLFNASSAYSFEYMVKYSSPLHCHYILDSNIPWLKHNKLWNYVLLSSHAHWTSCLTKPVRNKALLEMHQLSNNTTASIASRLYPTSCLKSKCPCLGCNQATYLPKTCHWLPTTLKLKKRLWRLLGPHHQTSMTLLNPSTIFFCWDKVPSCSQPGLELTILLSQSPLSWDFRRIPSCTAHISYSTAHCP